MRKPSKARPPKDMRENERIFFRALQDEKLKHKEHRFHLVTTKLLFAASIFGFSSLFNGERGNPHYLLLLVPFICFCTDLYIIADDYKVKRVGRFVLKHKGYFSAAEVAWERELEDNQQETREKTAAVNSWVLSLALCLCALLFFGHLAGIFRGPSPFELLIGVLMCAGTIGNIVLIPITTFLRKKREKNEGDVRIKKIKIKIIAIGGIL
jgi:hypothetical protein